MGGILAVFGEPGDPELSERLERMIACAPYRGAVRRHCENGVAIAVQSLGFDASLAVRGNWVAVFHGYSGDWKALLLGDAPELSAGSDAERLAAAFEVWGEAVFAKLRGEFAAVVYNRRERRLHAARGVVGCVPLYSADHGGRTYVGSEVRQILAGSGRKAELDEEVMVEWLVHGFSAREATLFQGVRRVVAPHVYRFSTGARARHPERARFWEPPALVRGGRTDPRDLALELRAVLERAVARAVPRVPFAVTLSGGLDSPTVWALVRRLASAGHPGAAGAQAVSLVFPGMACDESELIARVLAGTGGQSLHVDASGRGPLEDLDELCRTLDVVPYATTYFVTMMVDRAAAAGSRVLLTGHGGDAWLDGIPTRSMRAHLRKVMPPALLSWRRAWRRFARSAAGGMATHAHGILQDVLLRRVGIPGWLHRSRWPLMTAPHAGAGATWVEREPEQAVLLGCLEREEAWFALPSWEQLGALRGVQVRHPLMDQEVLEFALRHGAHALAVGGRFKGLLRRAVEGILPDEVRLRREKTVFNEVVDRVRLAPAGLPEAGAWVLAGRKIIDRSELGRALERACRDPEEFRRLFWVYSCERYVCNRMSTQATATENGLGGCHELEPAARC